MYLLKRKMSGGGFNIKPSSQGGYKRLMRNKSEGHGVGVEMFNNMDKGKKTPIQHLTQKMDNLKVRKSKPRKYISLNL
jgi:hypothetical protein